MIVEAQYTNPLSNSGFAIPNGSDISEGLPGFSLNQTEPTQGNYSGTFWSGEGQQHFHQDPQMDMQVFNFPYQGEDFAGLHPMFHRGSTASSVATLPMVSMNAGPGYMYATAGTESFIPTGATSITSQDPVGSEPMMYHTSTIMESPTLWDDGTEFLDSQRSSPILFEDNWSLPTTQLVTSASNSPFEPSHTAEGVSPRYVQDTYDLVDLPPYTTSRDRVMRKPIGPRPSKVASDMAARRQRLPKTSETPDESFKLSRSSVDFDNSARDHHLYHN
ncbi:C2H2 transcription factor, partial [Diplocarpon rosae]